MLEKLDNVCVHVYVHGCEFINSVGRALRILFFSSKIQKQEYHPPYIYSPEIINVQQVLGKLAIHQFRLRRWLNRCLFSSFFRSFLLVLVLMCLVRLEGCPIFQKMITKYLVPGTDLGVVVSTPLVTRKVELAPGGLVS